MGPTLFCKTPLKLWIKDCVEKCAKMCVASVPHQSILPYHYNKETNNRINIKRSHKLHDVGKYMSE